MLKKGIFVVILSLIVIVSAFFFFSRPTGLVSLDIDENYALNEPLSGSVSFSIESGDEISKGSDIELKLSKDGVVVKSERMNVQEFIGSQADFETIEQTERRCNNITTENVDLVCVDREDGYGQDCYNETSTTSEENCREVVIGRGDFYTKTGTYRKNISEFFDYTFSEGGTYTLRLSLDAYDASAEKEIVVERGAVDIPGEAGGAIGNITLNQTDLNNSDLNLSLNDSLFGALVLNEINITFEAQTFTEADDQFMRNANHTAYKGNGYPNEISNKYAQFDSGSIMSGGPLLMGDYVYATNFFTAETASDGGGMVFQLNASNVSQLISNYTIITTPGDPDTVGLSDSPSGAGEYIYVWANNLVLYQLNSSNVSQLISNYSDAWSSTALWSSYAYTFCGGVTALCQLDSSDVSQLIHQSTDTFSIAGSHPVIYNENVYVAGATGIIYKFNASDVSQAAQTYDTGCGSGLTTPAISNDNLYVGCDTGNFYQLNASNLSELAVNVGLGTNTYSVPSFGSNYDSVYINAGTELYQLNATNITQSISSYTIADGMYYPSIAGEYVYVPSPSGIVYQLNASDISKLISSYEDLTGAFNSFVAIGNDCAYAVNSNYKLYQLCPSVATPEEEPVNNPNNGGGGGNGLPPVNPNPPVCPLTNCQVVPKTSGSSNPLASSQPFTENVNLVAQVYNEGYNLCIQKGQEGCAVDGTCSEEVYSYEKCIAEGSCSPSDEIVGSTGDVGSSGVEVVGNLKSQYTLFPGYTKEQITIDMIKELKDKKIKDICDSLEDDLGDDSVPVVHFGSCGSLKKFAENAGIDLNSRGDKTIMFVLDDSLETESDCIIVDLDNVVLDGNGQRLRYIKESGSVSGVLALATKRTKITGFSEIRGFYDGILLNNVQDSCVEENNLIGNRNSGIKLQSLKESVIKNNIAIGNGFYGINLGNSYNNLIYKNGLSSNPVKGLADLSSNNNLFYQNDMGSNAHGMIIADSKNEILIDSRFIGNDAYGISIENSRGIIFDASGEMKSDGLLVGGKVVSGKSISNRILDLFANANSCFEERAHLYTGTNGFDRRKDFTSSTCDEESTITGKSILTGNAIGDAVSYDSVDTTGESVDQEQYVIDEFGCYSDGFLADGLTPCTFDYTSNYCGDGECSASEDMNSCPDDCSAEIPAVIQEGLGTPCVESIECGEGNTCSNEGICVVQEGIITEVLNFVTGTYVEIIKIIDDVFGNEGTNDATVLTAEEKAFNSGYKDCMEGNYNPPTEAVVATGEGMCSMMCQDCNGNDVNLGDVQCDGTYWKKCNLPIGIIDNYILPDGTIDPVDVIELRKMCVDEYDSNTMTCVYDTDNIKLDSDGRSVVECMSEDNIYPSQEQIGECKTIDDLGNICTDELQQSGVCMNFCVANPQQSMYDKYQAEYLSLLKYSTKADEVVAALKAAGIDMPKNLLLAILWKESLSYKLVELKADDPRRKLYPNDPNTKLYEVVASAAFDNDPGQVANKGDFALSVIRDKGEGTAKIIDAMIKSNPQIFGDFEGLKTKLFTERYKSPKKGWNYDYSDPKISSQNSKDPYYDPKKHIDSGQSVAITGAWLAQKFKQAKTTNLAIRNYNGNTDYYIDPKTKQKVIKPEFITPENLKLAEQGKLSRDKYVLMRDKYLEDVLEKQKILDAIDKELKEKGEKKADAGNFENLILAQSSDCITPEGYLGTYNNQEVQCVSYYQSSPIWE